MEDSPRALAFSNRLYQWLLLLYPAGFRREYGAQMAQVYRDECRHVQQQAGAAGIARLWFRLLPDLVGTVFAEYLWEVLNMSIEKFLRGSGLGAVAAGVAWILLFVIGSEKLAWDVWPAAITGLIFTAIMLLFLYALAGFKRRYHDQSRVKVGFWLCNAAAVWLLAGAWITLTTESGWGIFISGFFAFALGLALIGLLALTAGMRTVRGALPLLLAVTLVGFIITGAEQTAPIQLLFGTVYGLGWMTLGVYLWRTESDTPDSALPA